VRLLKKGKGLEVTMLLVCVCQFFFSLEPIMSFHRICYGFYATNGLPNSVFFFSPPPNSVLWFWLMLEATSRVSRDPTWVVAPWSGVEWFWLMTFFEFVLGMSLSLCVWHWLHMGKLSLLLDVLEILMLFIKKLICLENRLSSSFRCNIGCCSFAYWNNARV